MHSEPDQTGHPTLSESPLQTGGHSSNQIKFAEDTIPRSAQTHPLLADINISVAYVDKPDIQQTNARKRRVLTELAYAQKRPRWARDFLWETHEISESPSAQATETAPPVPGPPENELHNEIGLRTIHEHSDLFKIVTPVDVDLFESLLKHHPNRPLIDSVCQGFRQGFWPWAQTDQPGYPTTWDNADRVISNPTHQQFLREQQDTEIALEQYSPTFGRQLLPGMYSMPISVVPKPHSDKLRLINNHSAGAYSCNSMIPKHEGTVRLDGMRSLGKALRFSHQ
jgi:hypothetical protein